MNMFVGLLCVGFRAQFSMVLLVVRVVLFGDAPPCLLLVDLGRSIHEIFPLESLIGDRDREV
jgi:hypothetical protein